MPFMDSSFVPSDKKNEAKLASFFHFLNSPYLPWSLLLSLGGGLRCSSLLG
jgi:hypothetical protein